MKTCKLAPKGEYNQEWCQEVGGVAKQCQSCGNNPKNQGTKK